MPEIFLTQDDGDLLVATEKICIENGLYNFPNMGGKLQIPLFSQDGKERFVLNVVRGSIDITKITNLMRVRTNILLVRLDLGRSAFHRNPDGKEIRGPHVHFYREGYDLKYAWELPISGFSGSEDLQISFEEFRAYCNITQLPAIQWEMF